MKIGIPKETAANERRVACTPSEVANLLALGAEVRTERSAGIKAGFTDTEYRDAGAVLVDDAAALWASADVVCKVRPPSAAEVAQLRAGCALIGFLYPAQNPDLLANIAAQGATALAMDAVPRISRAQKLDALSSMAHIAGYRAVLEAGQHFGRFFTGQFTAAGKIPPAYALVIGAGVAGLSAIGTLVSLGAVVRAFDTRPEVREQIESMHAEFLMLDFAEDGSGQGGYAKVMSAEFLAAEMALFAAQAREVDIIITTALIPGKPAPKLITAEMVASMKPGGVIVDLAAEQGGNCALTEPDSVVRRHGVSIIGYTDLPGRMAAQASELYAANIRHLLTELTPGKDGRLVVDMDDQVIRGTTVVHEGEISWPPPVVAAPKPKQKSMPDQSATAAAAQSAAGTPGQSAAAATQPTTAAPKTATTPKSPPSPATKPTPAPSPAGHATAATPRPRSTLAAIAIAAIAILAAGAFAPASFMNHFIVFVLACFIGWQVVWQVTPALHTPLMSVTNAISSIIIIGALLTSGATDWRILAWLALLLASINIAGGFLVTQRMLNMFRK